MTIHSIHKTIGPKTQSIDVKYQIEDIYMCQLTLQWPFNKTQTDYNISNILENLALKLI
jgi:hypothetical protein